MDNKSIFKKYINGDTSIDNVLYDHVYGVENYKRVVSDKETVRAGALAQQNLPLQHYSRKNIRYEYEGVDPKGANPVGYADRAKLETVVERQILHQEENFNKLNKRTQGVKRFQGYEKQ